MTLRRSVRTLINQARSFLYQPLSELYERSLRWVTVDDLENVEPTPLMEGSRFPIPHNDAPFLMHSPFENDHVELPATKTVLLRSPIYSTRYNTVFLGRHTVLADSVNDRYPFKVGAWNLYRPPVQSLSGYATSFRARWSNYYHLLVDVLPRLELLRHPHFESYENISLICPGGMTTLEQTLIDRFDLPPRSEILPVESDSLLRPEYYVHVTFPTLRFCGAVPEWYRSRVRERLMPQRPSRRRHRILISRQNASKRRILNFDDLEAGLRPMGFTIVSLEELDFDAQVELFYDADAVVGAHGAGLTNILFADQVKVLELFPSWYVLPHYLYLALSLGHPYQYCVAESPPEQADLESAKNAVLSDLIGVNDADFYVDLDAVKSRLRSLGVH